MLKFKGEIDVPQSSKRGIALLLYGRERERVSQSAMPGTVLPMMPITLLPIETLRDL